MAEIGGRTFATNVFLAPLSGISDLPFRLICREFGAKMCFFEMVSSNAIVRGHRKTFEILKTDGEDRPSAAQILGNDEDIMREAAEIVLEKTSAEFIDINAACPARKVLKARQGGWLLSEPKKLFRILRKLSGSLKVPVTAKIRIGFENFDEREIKYLASGCEDSGAAALFVHGRCVKSGFSGDVNYEAIRKVKESVLVPVFGSGDIFSTQLAGKMFEETGCDGVLVARGALGNPWIFAEIENGSSPTISPEEKISAAKKHLNYIEKYKTMSPSSKLGFMKKTALWYIKGFPSARKIRRTLSAASSFVGICEVLKISD